MSINWKRPASLLLAGCMALMLASCDKGESVSGGSASSAAPDAFDKFDEYADDGLETVDLGGYNFTVATWAPEYFEPEEGNNEFDDLINKTMRDIEKRFNCTIEVIDTPYANSVQRLQPKILAGDKVADIIMPTVWEVGGYISSKTVQALNKLPHVRMDKPWWNQSMNKASTFNGETFVGVNCIANPIDSSWVMFYNKKIAQELELPDLYQLVKDGGWTWDKMREFSTMAVKDLDGNGVMDQSDRWGFGGVQTDLLNALMTSGGVKYVDIQDNKPVFALAQKDNIADMLTIRKMFHDDKILYPEDGDYTKNYAAFKADRLLFFAYGLKSGTDVLREMEGDFGVLPIPKGPRATEYTARVDHNQPCIVVPITNQDTDKTGLILEAISFATWKNTEERINYYADIALRDDESVEVVKNLMDASTFEISQICYTSGMLPIEDLISSTIRTKPNEDLATLITSNEEVANTALADFFGIQ